MFEAIGRSARRTSIGRRDLLKAGIGAGALLALSGRAHGVLAQSKAPLRIGCLNSFSKVFSYAGTSNLNGMNLYFDQIGWQAGGRKIELLRADDEVNPQIGLQKLRRLVESENVDIIAGPQASNVAMAIVGYIKQSKAFTIVSAAGATDLTRERIPYLFRTSTSTWQLNYTAGDWIYKNLSKELVVSASDFTGGHDSIDEFKQSFVGLGGKIVAEIYPPLGTNDYSSYLLEVKRIGAPAIYSFYAGTDAERFVRQYGEYGLKDKTRLLGSGFMLDSDTLPVQGKAALGGISALHYCETLETQENRKFVADYRSKYNEYPNVYSEYGYVAARVIAEAVNATDGETRDKDKLAEAVVGVRFNAPRGPFRLDPVTHNVIMNEYIREVAEIDGRLTNRVIATVENVRDPGIRKA